MVILVSRGRQGVTLTFLQKKNPFTHSLLILKGIWSALACSICLLKRQQIHLLIHQPWPSDVNMPVPLPNTHAHQKQNPAAWRVGRAGSKTGSCKNRQWVMSEQQGTLGGKATFEVFRGFYFMAALEIWSRTWCACVCVFRVGFRLGGGSGPGLGI